MGYNLLYGLHKATYDADCALFLSILKEEIKVLIVPASTASTLQGPLCSHHVAE